MQPESNTPTCFLLSLLWQILTAPQRASIDTERHRTRSQDSNRVSSTDREKKNSFFNFALALGQTCGFHKQHKLLDSGDASRMPNFSGRFFWLQSRTTLQPSISLVRVDTWRQQPISGPLSVGGVRTCSTDLTGVYTAGLQPLERTVCPNSFILNVSIEL